MTKYITLAIRETNPNNFAVLALDVKQDEIRSFALKHAEIIDKSGRVFGTLAKKPKWRRSPMTYAGTAMWNGMLQDA